MGQFCHQPRITSRPMSLASGARDQAHANPVHASPSSHALTPAETCARRPVNPAITGAGGFGFGCIPIQSKSPPRVQAKPAIDSPDDAAEREADGVAGQLMREPQPPGPADDGAGRTRPLTSANLTRVRSHDTSGVDVPPALHDVLRASGAPLDRTVESAFASRLGYDFSNVRVHTDAAAAQSARQINARAYTVGHHLVFDEAQFAPHTAAGQRLLAHELTHVVQQNGSAAGVQRAPGPSARDKENVASARQRAKALADRIRKEGTLSAEAKTTMITDLKFFEGAAWQAYNDAIRPALQEVTKTDDAESKKTPYWLREVSPGTAALADAFTDTFFPGADLQDARFVVSVAHDAVKASLTPDAIRTDKARAAFRKKHSDHSDEVLRNIDRALKRVTKDNPDLLIAYYEYYAKHDLTDSLPSGMSETKFAGATKRGNTDINPKVLSETSSFRTTDATSLLGGTLIHEYSHTPQDDPNNPTLEAKAYGIEYFFAERAGDDERASAIINVNSDDSRAIRRLRYQSYFTLRELYRRIEKGGPDAAEARAMSVEFISKNESDYRPELKIIYAEAAKGYVP